MRVTMSQTFNQNHSGSGDNVINVGPPRFEMTEEVMESVFQKVGAPRPIKMCWITSNGSEAAAKKLANYLSLRGFSISEWSYAHQLIPSLSEPVEFKDDELLVDVSVR